MVKLKKTSRSTDMVVAAPANSPASHKLMIATVTKEGSSGNTNAELPHMQPEINAPTIRNRQSES